MTRLAALAAVLALTAGCTTTDLAFRRDERVRITSPRDRSTQQLPVDLRWTIRDLELVGPGAGASARQFGVFVDRAPQPPGKPLTWLARNDTTCDAGRGCPDAAWFGTRQIYVTTETQLTLAEVAGVAGRDGAELHEATIVLLDADGVRHGESSFTVEFRLERGR